jgi:DNA-directed RNA polymerase subunit RPC12/RpoP
MNNVKFNSKKSYKCSLCEKPFYHLDPHKCELCTQIKKREIILCSSCNYKHVIHLNPDIYKNPTVNEFGPKLSINLKYTNYICSFCNDLFLFNPHKCETCTKLKKKDVILCSSCDYKHTKHRKPGSIYGKREGSEDRVY